MKNTLLFILILFTQFGISQETVGLIYNDITSEKADGYTLFNNLNDDRVFLINTCGEVVNQWDFSGKISRMSYILDNGNILQSSDESADIRDWDNNILWSINYNTLGFKIHHDIAPLPNGNFLVVISDSYTEEEMHAIGKDASFTGSNFVLDKVVEIQPVGTNDANIVWEWKFFDHLIQNFYSNKPNFGDIGSNPQLMDMNFESSSPANFTHVNGIDYNADLDQIILSARHTREIYIIDHSTTTLEAASHSGGIYGKGGDFLWRWGNPSVYDKGTASNQQLGHQHDPRWIKEGVHKGKISVFSNDGYGSDLTASSIHIIDPNPINGVYDMVSGKFLPTDYSWSFSGSIMGDVLLQTKRSGVQILPNNNALINETDSGRITEINSAGKVIWVYKIPVSAGNTFPQFTTNITDNGSFRAVRYPENYSGFNSVTMINSGIVEDVNSLSANCAEQLSIDSTHFDNLRVSPNPTNGILNFNTPIDQIKVYDIYGKIVFKKSNSDIINLENLANGLYLISISSKTSTQTLKIIKN